MQVASAIIVGTAGALLVSGGVAKFVDREGFERYLGRNPLTASSSQFLVRSVPVVEALVALLLLTATRLTVSVVTAAVLFAAYAVVSAAGPERECACGPFVPARAPFRIVMNALVSAGLITVAVVDPDLPISAKLLGASIAIVAALTVQTVSAWTTTTRRARHAPTHGH